MTLIYSIGTALIVYLIYAIPRGRLCVKAGQPMWKGWIPIYNSYMMYKISWAGSIYFLFLILAIIPNALYFGNAGLVKEYPIEVGIAMLIFYCVVAILHIIASYKLAKAFDHGVGFCIGLILLHPIFMYIMAFSKCKYTRVWVPLDD